MNGWYEDVVKGICIGFLSGGAVKFLSDKTGDGWSLGSIIFGGVGLIILAYVMRQKKK